VSLINSTKKKAPELREQFIMNNGAVYIGEWIENKRHGEGRIMW